MDELSAYEGTQHEKYNQNVGHIFGEPQVKTGEYESLVLTCLFAG